MTGAQRKYLRAIASLARDLGYPPTLQEIGDEVGVHSKNAVVEMLARFERDGLVTRSRQTARSLLLTPAGKVALR